MGDTRSQTGPTVPTGPQVNKLRQLGDGAWLYIITHYKGAQPRLRVIQDPVSRLKPETLYRQVQVVIKEANGVGHGEGIVLEV